MLTKEISEVEKEIKTFKGHFVPLERWLKNQHKEVVMYWIAQAKLSTLKSAQQKFDRFVEDLKNKVNEKITFYIEDELLDNALCGCVIREMQELWRFIDKPSSKQEGKC